MLEDFNERVALHEAAHAAVGCLKGLTITEASVQRTLDSHGHVQFEPTPALRRFDTPHYSEFLLANLGERIAAQEAVLLHCVVSLMPVFVYCWFASNSEKELLTRAARAQVVDVPRRGTGRVPTPEDFARVRQELVDVHLEDVWS
jgi:hypothetical protein